MTAKCKTCGAAFPAETIERMLERCEKYDPNKFGLFTDKECSSDVACDIIRNQWPALIRGLMANVDQRPLLTLEGVDAIPDSVCKAILATHSSATGIHHGRLETARDFLRAVAAHCRVVQPSSDSGQLDTGEADRIIGEAIKALPNVSGVHASCEMLKSLRSRLTLKPRRLTDEERMSLGLMIWGVHVAPVQARADIIAAEVARLWGMEVPEERTARALSDEEAEELAEFAGEQLDSNKSLEADGRAIYAEAMRLAGKKEKLVAARRHMSDEELQSQADAEHDDKSDAEVDADLRKAGIDMRPAFSRLHEMVDEKRKQLKPDPTVFEAIHRYWMNESSGTDADSGKAMVAAVRKHLPGAVLADKEIHAFSALIDAALEDDRVKDPEHGREWRKTIDVARSALFRMQISRGRDQMAAVDRAAGQESVTDADADRTEIDLHKVDVSVLEEHMESVGYTLFGDEEEACRKGWQRIPGDPAPALTAEEREDIRVFLMEAERGSSYEWAVDEIPWDTIEKLLRQPAQQPAHAITAEEAKAFECVFGSANQFINDLDEAFCKENGPPVWRANLAIARAVVERLRLSGGKVAVPVASVELSEDECRRFSQWLNFEGETGMAQARSTVAAINRILAARSARDVADMRPPFEGPKHGFAVPDEANANVNGLTGGANGND